MSVADTGFQQGAGEGATGGAGVQDPPAPAGAPPSQGAQGERITLPPPGQPAPDTGGQGGGQSQGAWTPERVEAERQRIRQEEAQRYASQGNTAAALKQELEAMKAREAEREKAAKAAQKAAEDEARKKAEQEMDSKQLIESRTADFERRLAEQQKALEEAEEQRKIDLAVLDKERKFSEMIQYRSARLQQEIAADSIHPVFHDMITGNTPEEVDASIEVAKQKTAALTQEVQGLVGQVRQATPTAPPTGAPPVGPLEQVGEKREFSLQEFADMPLDEYAKHRDQLGVTRGHPNRGMFH